MIHTGDKVNYELFNAYEVDWKRVGIIGAIIALIGVIGIMVYGYFANQKKKEAKHAEKYEEIVEYISTSEGAASETEKIFQFIYNHAPLSSRYIGYSCPRCMGYRFS
jgi:predicted negative regulator of RcsB-dependent stress response